MKAHAKSFKWVSVVISLCMLFTLLLPVAAAAAPAPELSGNIAPMALSEGIASPSHMMGGVAPMIYSPNQRLAMSFMPVDGKLTYTVQRGGEFFFEQGTLGMVVAGVDFTTGTLGSFETPMLYTRNLDLQGRVSHIEEQYIETSVPVTVGADTMTINIRVFDNGVAFQYEMAGTGTRAVRDATTFVVPSIEGTRSWATTETGTEYTNGEGIAMEHNPANTLASTATAYAPMMPGVTIVMPDGEGKRYGAILEAYNDANFPGSPLCALGNYTFGVRTGWASPTGTVNVSGNIATPWRVLAVADDLNELVNNNILYVMNPDPDPELYPSTDWIVPGRSGWSWLNGGQSAQNPTNLKSYTEMAAKLGFEYNTIDDGWIFWGGGNASTYDQELYKEDLAGVGEFGLQYNVKQFLWGGVNTMTSGTPGMNSAAALSAFLKLCEETNMFGVKLDFWNAESNTATMNLQLGVLKEAAEKQIMVNLHGIQKGTGWEVTYPNEVTREGIRGYEQLAADRSMYNIPLHYYTTQPFTRLLQGHADFTPHVRSAAELATLVVYDSPINMISTDPADMLASPAVEMIKSVPTVWDKTIVLPESEIGKFTVMAKEKDGVWYIAGINGTNASRSNNAESKTVNIDLAALGLTNNGAGYEMDLWREEVGLCATGVSSYTWAGGYDNLINETKTLDGTEGALAVTMPAECGFIMRLTPLALSQYGGEITSAPLAIDALDGAVVKYTTDGTEPSAENGETYTGPIDMEAVGTCRLTAKIVSGPGAGASVSHLFSLLDENGIVRSNLKTALNKAASVEDKWDIYTDESFAQLEAVHAAAKAVYDDPAATGEAMEAAAADLEDAYAGLKLVNTRGIYALLSDDFSNWESGADLSGKLAAYGPRGVEFDLSALGDAVMVDTAATKLVDSVLQAEFHLGGEPETFGFILRYKDADNYLALQNSDGLGWTLWEVKEGVRRQVPVQTAYAQDGLELDTTHHIKVVTEGANVRLYQDGVLQYRFGDAQTLASAGRYGVFTAGTEQGRSLLLSRLTWIDGAYYQENMVEGDTYDVETSVQWAIDGKSATLDLGAATMFDTVRYTGAGIESYEVAVSDDGTSWTRVATGGWSGAANQNATFAPVTARYVRLTALAGANPASSEFKLALFDPTVLPISDRMIPLDQMTASAPSAQSGEGADMAIDDNPGTMWHSNWYSTATDAMRTITLDLGGRCMVEEFWYMSRQNGTNGRVQQYEISVKDGDGEWTVVATGSFSTSVTAYQKVSFDPVMATQVRMFAKTTIGDVANKFASAAEVRVIGGSIKTLDTTALAALIDVAAQVDNDDRQYIEDSFARLEAALVAARAVLANPEAQSKVDNAFYDLGKALYDLKELDIVGPLERLLAQTAAMSATDYPTDKWEAFVPTVNEAKAMVEAFYQDPASVDPADSTALAAKLRNAMTRLEVFRVERAALADVIAMGDARLLETHLYTADSLAAFKVYVDEAKAALANQALYQADINQAASKLLQAAAEVLVPMAEATGRDQLVAMVGMVEDLNGDHYTGASWGAVSSAIAAAKAVLANGGATADELNAAYAALTAAVQSLALRANFAALNKGLADAQWILTEPELYISETIAGLADLAVAAQAVKDNTNATQSQVDAAALNLNSALVKVFRKAQKDALGRLLQVAGGVNRTLFTLASVEALDEAVEQAAALAQNPEAYQEDVDAAAEKVQNALQGLKLLEAAPAAQAVAQQAVTPQAPAEKTAPAAKPAADKTSHSLEELVKAGVANPDGTPAKEEPTAPAAPAASVVGEGQAVAAPAEDAVAPAAVQNMPAENAPAGSMAAVAAVCLALAAAATAAGLVVRRKRMQSK